MIIATVSTERDDIRAEIFGWTHEDIEKFVPGKFIGLTPGCFSSCYNTIFEYLANGFKLLGPPYKNESQNPEDKVQIWWEWWLTKED